MDIAVIVLNSLKIFLNKKSLDLLSNYQIGVSIPSNIAEGSSRSVRKTIVGLLKYL
jgi:hypothetical protein